MDAIFKALNDPARRALLDSLRAQDGQTLTELEEQLDMTRFGVMKHLKVLEDAHLITTRKSGRFKHHYLNAAPVQEILDRWIEPLLARPMARNMLDFKSRLESNMSKPDFVMSTYITCTQDALWDALTDPEQEANYNFAASQVERQGNKTVYYMEGNQVMLICADTQLTPKTRIERTFEPHWAGPDVPLPASRYVYLIKVEGSHCRLTVEHYDLPADMSDGVSDGWARTLAGVKSWLETGKPAVFHDPEMAQ